MENEGAELTFRDMFDIVRGAWGVILLFTLLGGLVAAAFAFFVTPTYRAQVLVYPVSPEASAAGTLARFAEQFAPLSGLVGGLNADGRVGGKDVWIATLRSRQFTERFIRERDLMPILFAKRWNQTTQKWKSGPTPTMEDAFELFDDEIRSVNEDRRSGLVTLMVEWQDRDLVADWANDLVARANEEIRARAIEESQQSISFLDTELRKTSIVELQQVIYRLIESKISEIMLANVRKEFAFMVVDPAVTPEADNFVRPRRAAMLLIGPILGLFVGLGYASVRWMRAGARRVHHPPTGT